MTIEVTLTLDDLVDAVRQYVIARGTGIKVNIGADLVFLCDGETVHVSDVVVPAEFIPRHIMDR